MLHGVSFPHANFKKIMIMIIFNYINVYKEMYHNHIVTMSSTFLSICCINVFVGCDFLSMTFLWSLATNLCIASIASGRWMKRMSCCSYDSTKKKKMCLSFICFYHHSYNNYRFLNGKYWKYLKCSSFAVVNGSRNFYANYF